MHDATNCGVIAADPVGAEDTRNRGLGVDPIGVGQGESGRWSPEQIGVKVMRDRDDGGRRATDERGRRAADSLAHRPEAVS
jgi:hypothetical protein